MLVLNSLHSRISVSSSSTNPKSHFVQIYFATLTNTIFTFDKYCFQFWQIHLTILTSSLYSRISVPISSFCCIICIILRTIPFIVSLLLYELCCIILWIIPNPHVLIMSVFWFCSFVVWFYESMTYLQYITNSQNHLENKRN